MEEGPSPSYPVCGSSLSHTLEALPCVCPGISHGFSVRFSIHHPLPLNVTAWDERGNPVVLVGSPFSPGWKFIVFLLHHYINILIYQTGF